MGGKPLARESRRTTHTRGFLTHRHTLLPQLGERQEGRDCLLCLSLPPSSVV